MWLFDLLLSSWAFVVCSYGTIEAHIMFKILLSECQLRRTTAHGCWKSVLWRRYWFGHKQIDVVQEFGQAVIWGDLYAWCTYDLQTPELLNMIFCFFLCSGILDFHVYIIGSLSTTCAPPPLGSTVQHWWPSMEKYAPASNPLAASQFQTGSGTKRLWALSTGGLAFDNAPFMLLLLTLCGYHARSMSRFRWAVQPGLANFLCDCCSLQCSCPGSGSLPWRPSPSPASPLSCFRQSATGAADGDCRGRQWPSPPAAGAWLSARPSPALGLDLDPAFFSGTAPFGSAHRLCLGFFLACASGFSSLVPRM